LSLDKNFISRLKPFVINNKQPTIKEFISMGKGAIQFVISKGKPESRNFLTS